MKRNSTDNAVGERCGRFSDDSLLSSATGQTRPEGPPRVMKTLPKKSSLVEETVRTLKEWISGGIIKDIMPGEIPLKNSLGVSRETLRGALELLCRENWIEETVKGRSRRIRNLSEIQVAPTTRLLPVTFLVDYDNLGLRRLLDMKITEDRLLQQGRSLQYLQTSIFRYRHLAQRLEKLVTSHPSAAWIIRFGTLEIQRWFEEREIPTLVYGDPFPGINLPYVTYDWGGAAFHAGIQLARQGHRHVALLVNNPDAPSYGAIRKGLLDGLATMGGGRVTGFFGVPELVADDMERIFSMEDRPTALVLGRAAVVISCYSWLLSRGLGVPRDLSVVSLANETWFSNMNPPLDHYRPSTGKATHAIAERVMDLVNFGVVSGKSALLPLEYEKGGTIGPPAV